MLHDRHPIVLYGVLGLGAALLLLPLLLFPLSSDNDTYHAMAFAMEQGKGIPYVGSWDQNFPGVVFYHWISIKLFGLSDVAFRLIDLLNRVAISLLLFTLARRYVSLNVAWLAVPLTCLLYFNAGFWNAGQRDGFALTWLLVALLQVTSLRIGSPQLLLFGAAIAMATFIRPTNAAFCLLLVPAILRGEIGWRDSLNACAAFLLSVILFSMPWLFQKGGLHEFYLATIQFNLDVYGPGRASFSNLKDSVVLLGVFHLASLVGLGLFSKDQHPRKSTLLLHGALAIGLVLLMGKYFTYHFEILAPVTIVLSLVAANALTKRFRFAPVAVLLLALFVFYPRGLVGQFFQRGADEQSLEQIQRNLASFTDYSLETEQAVTQYLRSTGIISNVEFLLLFPGLRWRSGNPGLSRFTTTYALTMTGDQGLTSYQQQWRRELDSMLTTVRPACIIAAQGPRYLFRLSNISPDSLLQLLPQASAMVAREYQLDTVIGGYKLYRLNDATQ